MDVIDESVKDQNGNIIYSKLEMHAFDHIVNKDVFIQENLSKLIKKLKSTFDCVIVGAPCFFYY